MSFHLSKLTKFSVNFLLIQLIILSIFQGVINAQTDYDDEIQLDYGIPIQLSEVSVPPSTIFEGYGILGFHLSANFSYNNGSIWINDQNEYTIWKTSLNVSFNIYIDVNDSSIEYYSLWANSSTLGTNMLYYSFRPEIFHAGNVGLIIAIIVTPIIITIIIVVAIVRKKEPHSVRVATRIVERMKLKYEAKHPEKVAKKERIFCPKCGAKAQDHNDNFCKECGFKLKE
ncbi:hypothetical protein ES703_59219 [subsurface metagenome]|nr:zinc ribbon domain-containing protein [Candidatus Lokiarchaeota archaeon]